MMKHLENSKKPLPLGLRWLEEEWPYPNPGGAGAVGGGATWQELPWWRDQPMPEPSVEAERSRE